MMTIKRFRDLATGWLGGRSAPWFGTGLLQNLSLFLRKVLAIQIVQISGNKSVGMVSDDLMVQSTAETAETTWPNGFEVNPRDDLEIDSARRRELVIGGTKSTPRHWVMSMGCGGKTVLGWP
jgi:hypothetical protein